jgi:Putative restriction endonuclease
MFRSPTAQDVGFIVEIADTTLRRDRGVKKTIYVRARIPIYWTINLFDRCIEVYADAKKPNYRHKEIFDIWDSVPFTLDSVKCGRVKVKGVLP